MIHTFKPNTSTTDQETDESWDIFIIWKINSGLVWAAGLYLWKKKFGTVYEQLLSAVFSCFHGQKINLIFFELFLAGNQSNHQNLVPSMQTYIFWLIFMGMKQRKKNQNGRLKKTEFFNSANSQYFSLVYSRVLGSKLVHSFFLLQVFSSNYGKIFFSNFSCMLLNPNIVFQFEFLLF